MTTWMCVEDDPGIYEMFLGLCEVLDVEGIAFEDGEAAVAWIEAVDAGDYDGELPELVLLDDLFSSAVSGTMVSARLRQSPPLKNVAVIMTTAHIFKPEELLRYLDTAQTPYLLGKPWPTVPRLQQYFREATEAPFGDGETPVTLHRWSFVPSAKGV